MGVPERKEQEKGEEKLFKLKMAENFLNLLEKKKKKLCIQKAQWTPSRPIQKDLQVDISY